MTASHPAQTTRRSTTMICTMTTHGFLAVASLVKVQIDLQVSAQPAFKALAQIGFKVLLQIGLQASAAPYKLRVMAGKGTNKMLLYPPTLPKASHHVGTPILLLSVPPRVPHFTSITIRYHSFLYLQFLKIVSLGQASAACHNTLSYSDP